MKKSVFSVDVNSTKSKKAAIRAVSGCQGIYSLSIDSETKTLTVVGDVDPVEVSLKLRKLFSADIKTVGQNEEKGDKKKKEEVKDDKSKQQLEMEQIMRAHYNAYYHNYWQPYYYYHHHESVEDYPSTCVKR